MNEWNEFLAQRGASFGTGAIAEVLDFGHKPTRGEVMAGFVAPLSDVGLLAASGDDASDFLHSQLSNDVKHLDQTQARLAGYCSPKGRLLATMLLWRDEETIFLQLPRAILPAIQKRLHMFVMRAKVKLADVSERQVVLGLGGARAQGVLADYFSALPAQPYAKAANADPSRGSLIRVADAFGAPRYQWIMPQDTAIALWPDLAKALCPLGNAIWRLAEIETGVPTISAATQEKFVPQMINFELIGGVNFKKGCYPGQEIVARSQYLGKLKRRMQLASVDAGVDAESVKAGTEVYSSADPEQPCGMIVNAEANVDGGSTCLVEIKLAALEDGEVRLGSASGAKLSFAALPYPLAPLA